jgi:F-type H+-transporting ATPase subunit a
MSQTLPTQQNDLHENEVAETTGVHLPEEHTEAGTDGEHVEHAMTLFAEPIVENSWFPITNALVTSWAVVITLVIISIFIRKNLKKVPGRLQNTFELVIEGGLSLADQVTGNRLLSKKIFPIVICIFFFVLLNNWFGLLPLSAIGLIQVHDGHEVFVPFLRGGTADINTTLALGIMAVIGSNLFGVFSIGAWKTFNKYVNLKALGGAVKNIRKDKTGLIVGPIHFFVGVLEIIGEIAKVASLSFRLFGNIFAGEVLLVSMAVLFAYALPIPFLFLEIIVGIIQALIFSMLTLVYFTIASHDHGEEHHDEEHKEAHA